MQRYAKEEILNDPSYQTVSAVQTGKVVIVTDEIYALLQSVCDEKSGRIKTYYAHNSIIKTSSELRKIVPACFLEYINIWVWGKVYV